MFIRFAQMGCQYRWASSSWVRLMYGQIGWSLDMIEAQAEAMFLVSACGYVTLKESVMQPARRSYRLCRIPASEGLQYAPSVRQAGSCEIMVVCQPFPFHCRRRFPRRPQDHFAQSSRLMEFFGRIDRTYLHTLGRSQRIW